MEMFAEPGSRANLLDQAARVASSEAHPLFKRYVR